MGLPLWVEPDESGSRAKAAGKSPTDPTTTRSPIRRSTSPRRAAARETHRRRQMRSIREQRLRTLMEAQYIDREDSANYLRALTGTLNNDDDNSSSSLPDSGPREDRSSRRIGIGDIEADSGLAPEIAALFRAPFGGTRDGRAAPRDEVPSDEDIPGLIGEDAPSGARHRGNERPRRIERDPIRNNGPLASGFWRRTPPWIEDDVDDPMAEIIRPYRSRRSPGASRSDPIDDSWVHEPRGPRPIGSLDPFSFDPFQPMLHLSEDYSTPRAARERTQTSTDRRYRASGIRRRALRVRYDDGLGDRDRSLSPEGDVWATLQSTLTPDPQPPSVGSSFASTTVSTATSLNPTVSSSRTSVTGPREEAEPPCDPVNEPDDAAEGSGADVPHADRSRRPTPHGRRSYAEVAADTQTGAGLSPDDPEWLSGMHRIVSGLASRQDIPDEWWAQAGLSRSMSWM